MGANEAEWTKSNVERQLTSSPRSRRRLTLKRPTDTTGPIRVRPATIGKARCSRFPPTKNSVRNPRPLERLDVADSRQPKTVSGTGRTADKVLQSGTRQRLA